MYLEYFETTAEDSLDRCHWDEVIKEKMREPVVARSHSGVDPNRAQQLIEFAWFDDPHRPLKVPVWDEAAKKKMREPVLTNSCHQINDETLRNLVEFASS